MGLSHAVSGDIASFRTPSRVPIESLKFHFLPKQAAGTPSPENPIPIVGWTGLNGKRARKNLLKFNKNWLSNPFTSNGITFTVHYKQDGSFDYINVKGARTAPNVFYNLNYFGATTAMKPGHYVVSGYITGVVDIRAYEYNPTDTLILNTETGVDDFYAHEGATASWLRLQVNTTEYIDVDIYPMLMAYPCSDTEYETYSEELIPITFPVAGTNKVDPSTIVPETRISVSDGVYSNTGTDTRTFVQLQVQLWKTTGTYIKSVAVLNNITTAGRKSLTFNVDTEDCHYIAFKHNGIVADFRVIMPFNLGLGIYTLSVDLLSADPTTVGGFRFKDIQLEVGNTATAYEPYSPDNTFYGGYIDPVAGEIVAEYALATAMKGDFGQKMTPIEGGIEYRNANKTYLPTASGTSWNTARQQQKFNLGVVANPYSEGSYGNYIGVIYSMSNYNMHTMRISEYVYQAMSDEDVAVMSYKLETPIHIPISVQDLKAFLNHNNFWSDANDITEVTYAVTESKDILATRKKAMDFDMGHRRKVKWNQIQVDGDFQDISNWESVLGYNTISISDGVMTCTCTAQPTQFYQTGFITRNRVGFLQIPYNHKILVSAYLRCSAETRMRIYGLVSVDGNTYIYQYNQGNVNVPANTWTRFIGFIGDRPETPPSSANDVIIKRFKPCIVGKDSDMSTIPNGTTFDCKNLMAFDLTQMFGLGNEPQTVEEFEHICEINGIDLTTYQPYDTGSDRWLIIP